MGKADLAERSIMVRRLAELHKQNEALRADLEAVAVAAQDILDLYEWESEEPSVSGTTLLREALARPGVKAVLKARAT